MTTRKYETYGTGEFDIQTTSIALIGKGESILLPDGSRVTLTQAPQLTSSNLSFELHTEERNFPTYISKNARVRKALSGSAKDQALLLAKRSKLTQHIRKVMNTRGLTPFSTPSAIAEMLISTYNIEEK